jgi:hypothetical protein
MDQHRDTRMADYIQRVADSSRRQLRSPSTTALIVRQTRPLTVGDRAFPVAACRIWNSLHSHATSSTTMTIFRNRLKIHLFARSFPV